MSRRVYSSTSNYRLPSEQGDRTTYTSLSTSRFTSRTPSSSLSSTSSSALPSAFQKSILETSTSNPVTSSVLSRKTEVRGCGYTKDYSDNCDNDTVDVKLSPKPVIRRYGRTTHSQAFSAVPSVPNSTSTPSEPPTEPTQISTSVSTRSTKNPQLSKRQKNTTDGRRLKNEPSEEMSQTLVHEREPKIQKDESITNQRTRHSLRTVGDANLKGDERSKLREDKSGHESGSESERRPLRAYAAEATERSNLEVDSLENQRNLRRMRRYQREENASSATSTSTSKLQNTSVTESTRTQRSSASISTADKDGPDWSTKTESLETEVKILAQNEHRKKDSTMKAPKASMETDVIIEDGKMDACEDIVTKTTQASLETEVRSSKDRLHRRYGVKKKSECMIKEVATAAVKITVMPPDSSGVDNNDSGVHLEEPSSSPSDRWSSSSSPIRAQWTDEDLDAFVRQLSNPQHHVTKLTSRDQTDPAIGRKASLDINSQSKDAQKMRNILTRSDTEGSSHPNDRSSLLIEKNKTIHSDDNDYDDKVDDEIMSHNFSGIRLTKGKKITKTTETTSKKSTLSKSKETYQFFSSTNDEFDDEHDEAINSSVQCNSSPECSDSEISSDIKMMETSSNDVTKDGSKKRRFRKMLSRPLNRSHSAGCAKDVPAHALFLNKQGKSAKENDEDETRKARASEGDIRPVGKTDDKDVDDVDEDIDRSHLNVSECQPGRMHKVKSADSALTSVDDLNSVSQPKSKSRNIAKKISRKMLFLRRRHTDSTLGMVGKDEGARRLATIDPEEVKEWSKSFENLLFDKTGLELFRGFLLTEHSDENIEFWIACENYKTSKSNKQIPTLAMKIFNDYVAVQSKREINLDSKTRNLTYDNVTKNPTRQSFDEAQRRVQALMEKDSYRRFLESEIYQDLVSGNVQHK